MVTSTCRMPAYLKSPIEFVAGDRDARASLLCVTELGHSLEFVLRGARQLDFVVANLETVERYHDQALANAEIAANGQYRKRDHLARLNDEIIDHANFLVMLVDDGTADNVRGAVARCHFLHIDVHERVRLRTHLRQHGCGRKKPADDDRACGGKQLVRKLPLHLFPPARTFKYCPRESHKHATVDSSSRSFAQPRHAAGHPLAGLGDSGRGAGGSRGSYDISGR